MSSLDSDTISAIATPSGQGGVGIVRVSGPDCQKIAESIIGFRPSPRYAHYCDFTDPSNQVVEQGIALFFNAPNSFTGDDVLELQGHGGNHILQEVLKLTLQQGARLARPGEFSERAFLNGKIDLLQAEAIADLIEASSEQASKSALRTLQGVFSARIQELVSRLIALRVQVEAQIDFSDEELDLQSSRQIEEGLQATLANLEEIFSTAKQGALLKEGYTIAIAGKPNAGKSSLLNALAETERAIVTDIEGTTRDILQERISIDGLPLNIVDTAGLRTSDDVVEQEGVRRANLAINDADRLLIVIDARKMSASIVEDVVEIVEMLDTPSTTEGILKRLSVVVNKIDLLDSQSTDSDKIEINGISCPVLKLSAKNRLGLGQLRDHLKQCAHYTAAGESTFIARERHLISLSDAKESINLALNKVSESSHWDLMAEDLRIAQQELNRITGDYTSDDLLGEIFSNFCVGK